MTSVRVAATLVALGLAATGCKAADALSTQEVVVRFVPGSTEADDLRVQQTCGVVPHASPEPIPAHQNAGQALTDVRFLVHPATDANLGRLYECLSGFHYVLGVDPTGM